MRSNQALLLALSVPGLGQGRRLDQGGFGPVYFDDLHVEEIK